MLAKIPHHVTGFWVPRYAADPAEAGSAGAGLLIGEAEARPLSERRAEYNGSDASGLVRALLASRGVSVRSPLPLGYGYAGSAVLAIAAALANFEPAVALLKAHAAEVLGGTGLGDVLAIATGGCLVYRRRAGAPGVGEAEGLKCPRAAAVAVDLKAYSTRAMLSQLGDKIKEAGAKALAEFSRSPSFEAFLELARRFSKEVGFLTGGVEEAAGGMRGLLGFYAKKGVAVFVVEEEWAEDAVAAASSLGTARAFKLVDRRIELRPRAP